LTQISTREILLPVKLLKTRNKRGKPMLTIYYKETNQTVYRMWGNAHDQAEATQYIVGLYKDGFDAYYE